MDKPDSPKKKLTTNEIINQISRQQLNNSIYSFVTFEGKSI